MLVVPPLRLQCLIRTIPLIVRHLRVRGTLLVEQTSKKATLTRRTE